jgi:hypothetical protein
MIFGTTVPFYSSPAYSPSANAVITGQLQENESLPNKVVVLFSERPEPEQVL